ncbi:MAG: hypothetical protein EU539_08495 [Promethearchaeota archaeon]|nr:MAG: hypothetical protein EU539_08495 [Candidatus Lokiarchaeota archaeon]
MEGNFFLAIILAIIFGALFFIEDYSTTAKFRLNKSFIAGISLAYFFLVLLPEIALNLPEFPLGLELFEFLFVLIGFIFIHVSEKLILQKVESKSQKRVRKLIKMEKDLDLVENNIEDIVNMELNQEELDEFALKDLGSTLLELKEKSKEIESEIEQKKLKIQAHIEKDLKELRYLTDFFYHVIVGILIVALLIIELLSGILFFIFALFRLIITSSTELSLEVYSDLGIEVKYDESKKTRIVLASAILIGVFTGIIFELFFPVDLEIIYILFSFISGIILYTIFREVIPEKEKGKPLYFLIGAVGFTIIIIIIKFFTTLLQTV